MACCHSPAALLPLDGAVEGDVERMGGGVQKVRRNEREQEVRRNLKKRSLRQEEEEGEEVGEEEAAGPARPKRYRCPARWPQKSGKGWRGQWCSRSPLVQWRAPCVRGKSPLVLHT